MLLVSALNCRDYGSIVQIFIVKLSVSLFHLEQGRLCAYNCAVNIMESLIRSLEERARKNEKDQTKYLRRLREKNPKKLDEMFRRLHDEVFAEMDCLDCGNCCKTTSPRFMQRDIDRIAKHFNMHPKTFRLQYLDLDEDDDWVLRKTPCPFLLADNSCSIYHVRPKACQEYPHTNVKNMRGHLVIARNNLSICPAVYEIVERIRKEYPL